MGLSTTNDRTSPSRPTRRRYPARGTNARRVRKLTIPASRLASKNGSTRPVATSSTASPSSSVQMLSFATISRCFFATNLE